MVTIRLEDSVAADLSARAASHGLTLEAYLAELSQPESVANGERLAGDEVERLLDEASVAGPSGAGTYRRADIYVDHD